MKVDIGLSIPQSETHGILELETNIKKDKRKFKKMVDQATEVKENKWIIITYILVKNPKWNT